ncbi:MAG TPA: PAS domain-containing sensor histidine kinase [Methanospirillum sp.]|nr:PAS domain-containing sensor histidine kinase [Methanospirillum sp.]
MKPFERIRGIISDLHENLPEETISLLESHLGRAEREFQYIRKKYEHTVREKEVVRSLLIRSSDDLIQRYRAIFEFSGVPMIILDENGFIILENSHFREYSFFIEREPDSGGRIFDFIHDGDREMALAYHTARRHGDETPSQYEVRIKGRGGEVRFVTLSVGLLPEGRESVVSVHDITERRHQKAELATHNERLEALLNLYQMTNEPETEVTTFAAEKATRLTMSKTGFITFIDEEQENISVEAFYSSDLTASEHLIQRVTYQASDLALIRQVMVTREPLILNNNQATRQVFTGILDHPFTFQRAMLIPIIEQNRVVAVAGVTDKEENYENADQLQLTVLMSGMWRLILRNRQEEALRTANNKLSLLSSLTRHDVLNLLTGLGGYLEISHDMTVEPDLIRFIEKEIGAVRAIEEIIAFTREYEMVGMKAPVWQHIAQIFTDASAQAGLNGEIVLEMHLEGIWVYADPLLIRVFSNFIDNSIRHGHHVSRISLTSEMDVSGLTLIYTDNGEGVPATEKEKIFIRGYGKHTGLGLFLIREIFSITGITIRETGKPGEGVRFEMHIPRGMYRLLAGTVYDTEESRITAESGER